MGAVLSAQSIRRVRPVAPFCERTLHKCGKTFGLGPASYDIRVRERLSFAPGEFKLASSVEFFTMPNDVVGAVMDKSTFARLGLHSFTTHIDPGWRGYLTLELVNLSDQPILIEADSPIVQIKFEWLDEATELPYAGKYQDQKQGPQSALLEPTLL